MPHSAPKESFVRTTGATIALVAAALLVGFGATAYVVGKTRESAVTARNVRFHAATQRLTEESQRRLNQIGYGLRGARGLYAGSDSVTRAELGAYVRSRDLDREFPGAVGMGFVARVMRPDLTKFVEAERADGAPDFAVRSWPGAAPAVPPAPDLYVIKHVFPSARHAAWGVDIGAEPARRSAAELAIRTGEATITAPITLSLGGTSRIGFLFFIPVYANGTNPRTPQEREVAQAGLVFAPMVLEKVLDGVDDVTGGALDFEIFDGAQTTGKALIVSHLGHERGTPVPPRATNAERSELRTPVAIGGRTWTFVTRPSPTFEAPNDRLSIILIGVCGGLLSLLLGALVWSLRTSQDRARNLAAKMTWDLQAAMAKAESASRAKSEFLANMSHEIRTPLTAILGFADLLGEEDTDASARRRRSEAVSTIKDAGAHLLTVINDILDLSKIEAEKMTVERIETPLTAVLHEIESMMRPRATSKGLVLDTVLSAPIPERIISDPTRLRQILMNLVGNAVKFTDAGSVSLTIGAEERDGEQRLLIDIEDTGPGLTPEQAARLFNPFGQADGTVTRKHGGTGLGLTICRRLAMLMAGGVTLAASEPGRGSRFRVDLPLVPAPGTHMVDRLNLVPRAVDGPFVSAKLEGRILLAEDGIDNQQLIAFHLKRAGATVDVADNGAIALRMIDDAEARGVPYDLLLTDMQMPEVDGYTLARTLRTRGSALAVVALTAHAMAEDRARCLAAGCDDFAVKPIDRVVLLRTCASWIGRAGGRVAVGSAA